MQFLFDHVLRAFAAVPVGERVLDLGCRTEGLCAALAQLGFEVYGCATDAWTVKACRDVLQEILSQGEAQQRIVHVSRLDALGFPDAFFDWIVVYGISEDSANHPVLLLEARRVLKPGGWLYATASSGTSGYTPASLTAFMRSVDLAVAEEPVLINEAGAGMVRGIYRRVDPGTAL